MKKQRNKSSVQIANEHIEDYALRMSSPESDTVQALIRSSDDQLEFIDMVSGNMVSQLLRILIQSSGARRILEVGTFTGYSALQMAEVLPEDGNLITIELNNRYQKIAEQHFKQFDRDQKIRLWKGDARKLLDDIEEEFDLVFLDADKMAYPAYFEQIIPLLRQGGLLVADNVLWEGTVLEANDPKAKALDEFNEKVAQDSRVEQVLLTVRDGLTIARKI